MSEVALQIGGRTYRVACAPGEEDRVSKLGATIAEKLASLGNPGGPDAQNLLFAALLLADEVQEGRDTVAAAASAKAFAERDADTASNQREELKARITDLEAELTRMQGAARDAAEEAEKARMREAEMARRVEELEAAPASAAAAAAAADMSALAPALEHFAEMLEECADKLESGRAAS